jgi:minor extracellular serine protease Vpr
MKKLITLGVFLLMLGFSATGQTPEQGKIFPEDPTPAITATREDGVFSTKGMSAFTAFLLQDLHKMKQHPGYMSELELIEKYGLRRRGNNLYANSFIIGTDDFSISDLRPQGVIPGRRAGKVHTALVPINNIQQIAAMPAVKLLQIGEKMERYMDSARMATNVDKVHQGLAPLSMAYTGKDVVVGVIDGGFDLTHPNFYDTSGVSNYRIKRVWKQADQSGVPPTGYNYGSEFTTEPAILASKTDDSSYSSGGNHGSHVAGTAAGAGGYPNSPYKGVAYESDIVLVGYTFTSADAVEGIQYIHDYAASVGKPSVINMSFGSLLGPHDGTSAFDQFCDSATGPGSLLVVAAGNDGSTPAYFGHDFQQNDTVARTFLTFKEAPAGNGAGVGCIYGVPNENFSVRVRLFNTATSTLEDVTSYKPATIGAVYSDTLWGSNNMPSFVNFYCGYDAETNRPNIYFQVINSYQFDGSRKLVVEIKGYNTSVKMWGSHIANKLFFTNSGYLPPVYTGSTEQTIGDGGCGAGVITVGASTVKDNWFPLNNVPQSLTPGHNWALVGDIAPFSSKGPTTDGRVKPDITAPGNILASSVNSFSPLYDAFGIRTVKSVTHGSNTWLYGMMEGTSMAAPIVTGILALWLEQNPNLTREQAIAKMKATAITDNFTGTIPANGSNTWGWGKINAFAGLVTVSVENVPNQFGMKIYPNPATTELNIAFDEKVLTSEVVIFDITGKTVFSKNVKNISAGHVERIGTEVLASGSYILKINNDGKVGSYKIVKQ